MPCRSKGQQERGKGVKAGREGLQSCTCAAALMLAVPRRHALSRPVMYTQEHITGYVAQQIRLLISDTISIVLCSAVTYLLYAA